VPKVQPQNSLKLDCRPRKENPQKGKRDIHIKNKDNLKVGEKT